MRSLLHLWPWACAMLLAAALASPSTAVVISSANDAPNLVAPASNPGWSNVGRLSSASAVYLGNRWVITANHVSQGALRLPDGRQFDVSVGSDVRLNNGPIPIGGPDLRMFRLAEDPGLAPLDIGETTAVAGDKVMMIGAGVDRATKLIGWQPVPSGSGFQWNEVPVQSATLQGHFLLDSAHLRWGINQVSSPTTFGSDNTFSFATRFDRFGLPFEAQATTGDSGGGVFRDTGGAWELIGIMTSVQLLTSQPADTVAYGEHTDIADLTVYRQQILDLVNRDEPLWQNQANHFDVGGSGSVTPGDLLVLVNELLSKGPHELSGAPGASDEFLDVNGDYNVTTSDAMQVINYLLSGASLSSTAAAPGVTLVPEPSGAALAAWGLLVAAAARLLVRRRALRY